MLSEEFQLAGDLPSTKGLCRSFLHRPNMQAMLDEFWVHDMPTCRVRSVGRTFFLIA